MTNEELLAQQAKQIQAINPTTNIANQGLATYSPQQSTASLVNPGVGQLTTPNQMGRPAEQTNEQANLNNPLWQAIQAQANKDKANLMATTTFQAPPQNFGLQASLEDVKQFPNAGFTPQQVDTIYNRSNLMDRLTYNAGNAYDATKAFLNIKPQQTGLQSASSAIQNNIKNTVAPLQTAQPTQPVNMPSFGQYDPTKTYLTSANQLMTQNQNINPLQLPATQFNKDNLTQNYQNAMTAPGTQIDTGAYNQLTGGFQAKNQAQLDKTEAQKQEIFNRYNQLKQDQVRLGEEAGKSTNPAQAARLLGRAAKSGAEAGQLSKDYTGLVAQDTRLAQDQQAKLILDNLETERLKAFKQPEYAQELAKTNLATQNKSDLAMQEYDNRMKELGIEYGAKSNLGTQGYKQDIMKSALAVKTPENISKSLEVSNAMRNLELSKLAVTGTPEQRQQAQQELMISKSVFGKQQAPTEYKLGQMEVDGNKVAFGYDPTKPVQPQIMKAQYENKILELTKQSTLAKDDKTKQAQINAELKTYQDALKGIK